MSFFAKAPAPTDHPVRYEMMAAMLTEAQRNALFWLPEQGSFRPG